DGGASLRDRHDPRQARAVCGKRAVRDAHRRRDGAALDLYRPGDRVQPDAVVRGGDHGPARRRRDTVRPPARRDPAGSAVRAALGQLPQLLQHPARRRLHLDRVWRTERRCRPGAGVCRQIFCETRGTTAMTAAPLLEISGARKAFGGLIAVDEMAFSVVSGEIVGLIGPNGSGKTTMLNLISGALRCDGGEMRFKQRPISRLATHRIARLGIGRTFQLVRVLGSMTCRDNVLAGLAFGASPAWGAAAVARADALIARVGLDGKAAL